MNVSLIISFIFFNVLNVVIQTIKSIATIKCGKTMAAVVNAVAYGLYTYIIVLTTCELALWIKVIVVALANLVGVWVVKYVEEKKAKDKLWKVELAVLGDKATIARDLIEQTEIPMNYFWVGDWVMFNAYCETKADTHKMSEIAKVVGGKISAYESKAVF